VNFRYYVLGDCFIGPAAFSDHQLSCHGSNTGRIKRQVSDSEDRCFTHMDAMCKFVCYGLGVGLIGSRSDSFAFLNIHRVIQGLPQANFDILRVCLNIVTSTLSRYCTIRFLNEN
jgi:hypothetical protein